MMPEFVKRITDQITEYWNKFSTKNKIQIITGASIVIIALVVLTIVLNQPTMIKYASGLEPSKMNELKSALEDEGIAYQVSDDASTIYIDASRKQDVVIAADALGVLSDADMTWKEALSSNSLATTSDEKKKKFELAFQEELNTKIEALEAVKKAYVTVNTANQEDNIFKENQQSSATVIIEPVKTMNAEQVKGIVSFLTNSIPNLPPENITIMSTTNVLLYAGNTATDLSGDINNKFEFSLKQEEYERSKLMSVLLAGGKYSHAVVAFNLEFDFDEKEQISENYDGFNDTNKGIVVHQIINESEGKNASASGEPGTGSNDGTTDTFVSDNTSSETSTKSEETKYLVDKVVKTLTESSGDILRDQSSVSVVLNQVVKHDQALLEADGTLDNTTWEAYKSQNENIEEIEVEQNIIDLVKNTSRIDNATVIAYKVPLFIDKEVNENPISDYLSIGFIVLLVIILVFVIYKSTAPDEIVEIEPELSVEDMLATTNEANDLEEIEFDDKSETRKQIEKFVDDNPEAVALLMRNWLNEDWE